MTCAASQLQGVRRGKRAGLGMCRTRHCCGSAEPAAPQRSRQAIRGAEKALLWWYRPRDATSQTEKVLALPHRVSGCVKHLQAGSAHLMPAGRSFKSSKHALLGAVLSWRLVTPISIESRQLSFSGCNRRTSSLLLLLCLLI